MMKIIHVVGARPNFMKVAPIMREMAKYPNIFNQVLVHTGQHYDNNMSSVFFDELDLPKPDINLEVGSGSHSWQTAQVMLRFESILEQHKPDWVFVPGDVNSTLASALVASKLHIKVAHVEAGLRSFDRTMPEEINRVLTDHIADLLFTTEPSADENLRREGIVDRKVHFVGNVMIDTLVRLLPRAESRWPRLLERLGLDDKYIVVTLHRPSNVDDPETLQEIMLTLADISKEIHVIFPVHPRTRQRIVQIKLPIPNERFYLLDPLGYLDFLALIANARLVLTDSGGIQEETTYLGVPCLTARPSTERPVTVERGTNRLVMIDRKTLIDEVSVALKSVGQLSHGPPELWDGHVAPRIVRIMETLNESEE